MRLELFWNVDIDQVSPEVKIENAINFGGFEFISELQQNYGMELFKKILTTRRGLSRKAVNYWCEKLGLDREQAVVFRERKAFWSPFR
jgi:hypothetical protein